MTEPKEKVVGILGGMGPDATVDLMQRIIRLTPALDDADHIRCIVDNNPKVPSRIKALIEGHGEDPGPCMADMGRRLEAWGADFLVIACNTAHYYYDAVQEAVGIPVINLIGLVARHIKTAFPNVDQVGILASPAVAKTGLYTRRLQQLGIGDVWPDTQHQEYLLGVIKSIKQGDCGERVIETYTDVCDHMKQKGVSLAIVACTELSAIGGQLPLDSVDAADILAKEIVQVATNRKDLKRCAR